MSSEIEHESVRFQRTLQRCKRKSDDIASSAAAELCKRCNGLDIFELEHNRIKSGSCKQCGGSSICEHNRQRVEI